MTITHLVLGGSKGTQYETETSDTDVFLISDQREQANEVQQILRCLKGPIDLESRTLDWLVGFSDRIRAYRPPLGTAFSPFSFSDLRFLTRVINGNVLIASPEVVRLLEGLAAPLRLAASSYLATMLVVRYQDAYGLLLSKSYQDISLLSGELIQHACLVSLLNCGLYDLSLKTAPRRLVNSKSIRASRHANELISHACTFDQFEPEKWGMRLLSLINAVIASGLRNSASPGASGTGTKQPNELEYCILGVPCYSAVISVRSNRVALVNGHYLESYLHL